MARWSMAAMIAMALLAFAPVADASTASFSDGTVTIVGGAEANNIELKIASNLVVRDTAGITAGPGCSDNPPGETAGQAVGCGGTVNMVQGSLGNGDDIFQADLNEQFTLKIDGENGNDQLNGAFHSNAIDTFDGGEGNDDLVYGDIANGGPGNDYLGETALAHAGPGADTITGTGFNDELFGDEDDDNIEGRSGHDHIVGGPGQDSLRGDDPGAPSPGDDRIETRDGYTDRVQCDGGNDTVTADQLDKFTDDGMCETMDVQTVEVLEPPEEPPPVAFALTGPASVNLGSFVKRGYPARVTASDGVKVTVSLRLKASVARKLGFAPHSLTIGKTEVTGTGKPVTTRVKPRRKFRTKLSDAEKPFAMSVVALGGGKSRKLPVKVKR